MVLKAGISASCRQGESLNLIPPPAASRQEGICTGLGFVLTFINLTTCGNSGRVGPHQSDTRTLAAVFWVTWEAHPGPGAFREEELLLLAPPPLQERPRRFFCSSHVSVAAPASSAAARSSHQSRAEVCVCFFLAGFQLGVEERLMCGKRVRPLCATRGNVAVAEM